MVKLDTVEFEDFSLLFFVATWIEPDWRLLVVTRFDARSQSRRLFFMHVNRRQVSRLIDRVFGIIAADHCWSLLEFLIEIQNFIDFTEVSSRVLQLHSCRSILQYSLCMPRYISTSPICQILVSFCCRLGI